MTLDELIAQITNPQEFTRLCNSVFTDIYGEGFQVIDGTRGDNGNDGYVESERRMLAMYCPIKPEQKTDAGYLEKIRSDFAKAVKLRDEKKYVIETWTFVTPRKLSDDVISKMRSLGERVGIRASHQEATFLANELYQRGHLLKGFPALQLPDLAEKIEQLTRALTGKDGAAPVNGDSAADPQPPIVDEAGERRMQELLRGIPSREAKAELKAVAYATTDAFLEINAILALFQWFDPTDDDRAELLQFANRGIERSEHHGCAGATVLFHAHKAALFLWDFNTALIQTRLGAAVEALLWFGVSSLEQSQQQLTRLRKLDESWRSETTTALDLLKKCHDRETVGAVLLVLGNNMGQLALTYRQIRDHANADRCLAQCKALLMAAKDVCAGAGEELAAVNAVFNLANQLRWHGGKAEALALVKATIPVAEKHGDRRLLQKAKWLQRTLETGEIPDYLAGERRQWGLEP
jgi:hypothetical protein